MTQNATVVEVLKNGRARIVVARQSACAHDCSKCGGCGATPQPIYAEADNEINARPGDRVEVESSSSRILGAAVAVYIVPLVLFFVGYFLFRSYSEGTGYLCGGVGFAVGVLGAFLLDRYWKAKGGVQFRMIRKL